MKNLKSGKQISYHQKNKLKVSVFGLGNFGFALLKHLTKKINKDQFTLHAYDKDEVVRKSLKKKRQHSFLHPGILISKSVTIEDTPKNLIDKTDILVLAVTSNAIKKVINSIKPYINKKIIIVNTAKALEAKSGERFSSVISNCLKNTKHSFSIAMLAGGTIARDLFRREPLGIDIASRNKKTLKILKEIFTSDNLDVYTTTDLNGVEYAAAFKNVISIFAGLMKGLGFSYGSETHIISRTAGEVKKLVVKSLGGKEKTFSNKSQCWGNDMWMSATGNTRNREFGILLGRGYSPQKALTEMTKEGKTVEGINTVKAIKKIIKNKEHKFPLLYSASEVILNNKDPRKTILNLMKSNKI